MIEINNNITDFVKNIISKENSAFFKKKRIIANDIFMKSGFFNRHEDKDSLALHNIISKNYVLNNKNIDENVEFNCQINNFNTDIYYLLNGRTIKNYNKLNNNYLIDNINNIGEKIYEYFDSLVDNEYNGFYALNTAAFTGGFYIEIPENTTVEIPLQLISVNNFERKSMFNVRNIIVVGKNSQIKILQCDDVFSNEDFLVNNLTEIFVGENAHIELYKLHNLSNNSGVINSIFVKQDSHSVVKTYNIELNAGYLCGNLNVLLQGDFAEHYAYGIYLADKQQEMDNYINIEHVGTDGISQQIFKGLIDDMARTVFNGTIVVHRDAQRTLASQVNRNILLTDKAKAYTKPYLEIYADDVKCNHGSTIGQLDEDALFYMQQRCMSYENAKKLLMNAFLTEVVDKIDINPVKMRIFDMVKKRLAGELYKCDNCILRCRDAKFLGGCE